MSDQSGPLIVPIDAKVKNADRDAEELRARTALVARGGARAAVLGVNDGLVTNLAIILGLSGASASASSVRLAGFASLVAGAFSMAAGEWVSVRSQVDLFGGVLTELRTLLQRNPQLVLEQLTAKLVEDGIGDETAQRVATELPLNEQKFLNFTANAMFGLNPDELGSPRTAALSSLALFAVGALVPLVPWFFTSGFAATSASVVVTGLASLVVGGWIARSAGASVHIGALRQFAIAASAAAVTFGIGRLFGTAVS